MKFFITVSMVFATFVGCSSDTPSSPTADTGPDIEIDMPVPIEDCIGMEVFDGDLCPWPCETFVNTDSQRSACLVDCTRFDSPPELPEPWFCEELSGVTIHLCTTDEDCPAAFECENGVICSIR